MNDASYVDSMPFNRIKDNVVRLQRDHAKTVQGGWTHFAEERTRRQQIASIGELDQESIRGCIVSLGNVFGYLAQVYFRGNREPNR